MALLGTLPYAQNAISNQLVNTANAFTTTIYSNSVNPTTPNAPTSTSTSTTSILTTASTTSIPTNPTTFTEFGMPNGYIWNVSYNGIVKDAISPTNIKFPVYTGNYAFTVLAPTQNGITFTPSPANGYLQAGSNLTITFNSVLSATSTTVSSTTTIPTNAYTTFTENGLPANAVWSVSYNYTAVNAVAPGTLTFGDLTGNYPFVAQPVKVLNSTYLPAPSNGTLTAGSSIDITYVLQASANTSRASSTSTSIPISSSTSVTSTTTSINTTMIQQNQSGLLNAEIANILSNQEILPFLSNGSIILVNTTNTSSTEIVNTSSIISQKETAAMVGIGWHQSFAPAAPNPSNKTYTPAPTPISTAEMSTVNAINATGLSRIMTAFKPLIGTNVNTSVVLFNVTRNVTYGGLMQHSKIVGAAGTLHYVVYNIRHVLTVYTVTVMKAQPPLTMNIDGATIHNAGVYPIHVPILPGQKTWNLSISATSTLLHGNAGSYTYYVGLSNGSTIAPNTTISGNNFTQVLQRTLPAGISATVTLDFSGNANYTGLDPSGITIPTSISHFWAVNINNTQSVATGNYLQIMVPFNALANSINTYADSTLNNTEWFYANGTLVQSWFEGNVLNPSQTGSFNSTSNGIYWIKLNPSVAGSSSAIVYYGAATFGLNLLSSTADGMAPQLFCASGCPQTAYGQYDSGVNVFDYYNPAPASTSGWTVSGTAGVTTSAPSGSYFQTSNSYYANSASGDYLHRTIPGFSENQIITFWVYTTGLGNLFFLTNTAGAGQMGRLDGRGGTDYSGLAATASWTSWSAPPSGLSEATDIWYKYDIVIAGSTATSYIGPANNMLETLGTMANSKTVAYNGNSIGLVGDGLGSSHITYWNGFVLRRYPPNGIMPSVSFGPVQSAAVVLTFSVLSPVYSDSVTVTATCSPNTDTCAVDYPILGSHLCTGVGTCSYTYQAGSLAPGSYSNYYANDITSGKVSIAQTLTIGKSTPALTLPNFPSNLTYGNIATVTANIVTLNNQLTANDYVNNGLISSFTTQNQFTESSPGLYTVSANTLGNANYTSASITKTFYICPKISSFPANLLYYTCIDIINSQNSISPANFQQMIRINESSFSKYIEYNGILANFEYFNSSGNVMPAWIESNQSGTLVTWVKLGSPIPANSNQIIFLGFASNTLNLLSSSGTVGIGEYPTATSTYGQYDDGSSVFLNYFSGDSLTGWTTAGTSGLTTTAPSGSPFGTDAFYANGGNGDYLYTQGSGQSANMIIEYYTDTANLDDLFFLASSTGVGQIARVGNGGGWYGIAASASWTAWSAPPDNGRWSNEWLTMGVTVVNGAATMYVLPGGAIYGSELGQNQSNVYTISNDGNYIGLVGDAASSSTVQYWNGAIVRAYPPEGVMPSAGFTSAAAVTPATCQISLSLTALNFGSIIASHTYDTNQIVTDTNNGPATAFLWVNGGNWIGGGSSFGVGNTLWDVTSESSYIGNALSSVTSNTNIPVYGSGGSNSIYFGVQIPAGQTANVYSQNIIITNVC